MFEYINVDALFVMLLVSLVIYYTDAKYLLVLIIILVLLEFYSAYATDRDVKNNIKGFAQSDTLRCSSGGGLYSKSDLYSVSKKEGWILKKDYFQKESLLIRADQCKLLDIKQ